MSQEASGDERFDCAVTAFRMAISTVNVTTTMQMGVKASHDLGLETSLQSRP